MKEKQDLDVMVKIMPSKKQIQQMFDKWQEAREAERKIGKELYNKLSEPLPRTDSDSLFWIYVTRGRINRRDRTIKILMICHALAEQTVIDRGFKLNRILYRTGAMMVDFREKPCLIEHNFGSAAIPVCRPNACIERSFD